VGFTHVIEKGFGMNQDYTTEIKQSLSLLTNATGQPWEYGRTGGNCDAFTLSIAGKGYYMITNGNAQIPLLGEWNDEVVLGWYEELADGFSGDCETLDDVTNLETLSAWARLK
jgi:hypothetical protein